MSKIRLAEGGQAQVDIVIHPDASNRIVRVANDLKEKLEQITGSSFLIDRDDGSEGIVIGTPQQFPNLGYNDTFDLDDPFQVDHHILKSHDNGLHLIGHSEAGAINAVWTLLMDVGFRQYFPQDPDYLWEHIPYIPTLEVEVDRYEKPDFLIRRGPKEPPWSDRGRGFSDRPLWEVYDERNRITENFSVRQSHTWHNIVSRNQDIIDANPHFAVSDKLRVSAVGEWQGKPYSVVQMVIDDQIRLLDPEQGGNPNRTSLSMDPSDGTSSWYFREDLGEDPDHYQAELDFKPGDHGYIDPAGGKYEGYDGSHITDRVVFINNEVAKGVNEWSESKGYGVKRIGYYAYAHHKNPPNIQVHPLHVISVVGGFNSIAPFWAEKGAKEMGVYDRLNLIQGRQGLPQVQQGGEIRYIVNSIPSYHANNARIYQADSTDTWGLYGLTYYLVSQKLWDVNADTEAQYTEFLDNMFGDVAHIMREHFDMVHRWYEYPPRSLYDYVAWGYKRFKQALEATSDPIVKKRIRHLALYWRYIELFYHHRRQVGDDGEQSTGEDMMRHAYRMQLNTLSPVTQLYRHYVERSDRPMDPTYEQMEEFNFRRPINNQVIGLPSALNNRMPWEDNGEFTDEEIDGWIEDGAEKFPPVEYPFKVKAWKWDTLVPLPSDKVQSRGVGRNVKNRGTHHAYVWLEPGQEIHLLARTDARHSSKTGNPLNINLSSWDDYHEGPVDRALIETDQPFQEVVLRSVDAGVHWLSWGARSDWSYVHWPEMKITGADDPYAGGLWSRTDTHRWDNANGWNITRTSDKRTWLLRNISGETKASATRSSSFPGDATDWDGVFENATLERHTEMRIVQEYGPFDPYEYDRGCEWFFYVPKGTEVVGGNFDKSSRTEIYYPDGSKVEDWQATGQGRVIAIPVPEGMDGKLWKVDQGATSGEFSLLTVPAFVGRSSDEMLIPSEVHKADFGEAPEPEPPEEPAPIKKGVAKISLSGNIISIGLSPSILKNRGVGRIVHNLIQLVGLGKAPKVEDNKGRGSIVQGLMRIIGLGRRPSVEDNRGKGFISKNLLKLLAKGKSPEPEEPEETISIDRLVRMLKYLWNWLLGRVD